MLAYQLMNAAGLQRARLTGIVLKGEDLIDADQVAEQISLDAARESRLVAEQAMDRIRDKFGSDSIGPAAIARLPGFMTDRPRMIGFGRFHLLLEESGGRPVQHDWWHREEVPRDDFRRWSASTGACRAPPHPHRRGDRSTAAAWPEQR